MDAPSQAQEPSPIDAGTADAKPRAMNGRRFPRIDRLYDRIRDVYLTADTRSLSAGRIVLALVLLRDLFGRWAQLGLWYTNDGIIPNHTMLWRPPWDHVFSLFYLATYTARGGDRFHHLPVRLPGAAGRLPDEAGADRVADLHVEPARPHPAVRQRRRRGPRSADRGGRRSSLSAATSRSTRCWRGGARRRRRPRAPRRRPRPRPRRSGFRWRCWR